MRCELLVIDNYDSFVYNLVQYLEELDCNVEVTRNDAMEVDDIDTTTLDGSPEDRLPGHRKRSSSRAQPLA